MTMNVRLTSTGFKRLGRNGAASSTRARGSLNRALRQIGRVLTPSLKGNTPRRNGRLANSTRSLIGGGVDSQVLEIRQGARSPSGAFYGGFVRSGTRPHIIEPNRAKALRFTLPGGKVVFARRVMHPGTAPNDYHVRTLRQNRGKIQDALDEAGLEMAADFTRGVTGSRD